MKSEKVKEFIDGHVQIRNLSFTAADIQYCAMLAEQEAEERMRGKAVEAFKSECVYRDQRCKPDCEGCGIVKQFIQKLNEE